MERLKILSSPDGKSRLAIYGDGRGLFRYTEFRETICDRPARRPDLYWRIAYQSRLFGSLQAAEGQAAETTSWLRDTRSN